MHRTSSTTGRVDIAVRREGAIAVCEVAGEFDTATAEHLLDRLDRGVGIEPTGVVLDLDGLTYLDSAGVRVLFEFARRLRMRRQELRIAVPSSGVVRRILVLIAVADVVALDERAEDSVRALLSQ